MREVVFVDGARSAFTNMGGGLRDLASTEIAGFVLRGLLKRTGILDKIKVDGVFCGNALRDAKASNPARYAALCAGLPVAEREANRERVDLLLLSLAKFCVSVFHLKVLLL